MQRIWAYPSLLSIGNWFSESDVRTATVIRTAANADDGNASVLMVRISGRRIADACYFHGRSSECWSDDAVSDASNDFNSVPWYDVSVSKCYVACKFGAAIPESDGESKKRVVAGLSEPAPADVSASEKEEVVTCLLPSSKLLQVPVAVCGNKIFRMPDRSTGM